MNASQRPNDNSLTFAENQSHPTRAIVTQPEELQLSGRLAEVCSEMRMLKNFTSVPAKYFAFVKIEEAIEAIRIGALGQHDRRGKRLLFDSTPEKKIDDESLLAPTLSLPLPRFFDLHVIAAALVVFANAFFDTTLDSRL